MKPHYLDAGRWPRALFALLAPALVAIAVLSGTGADRGPSHAYGAQPPGSAEASPRLLLEGPDWRVQNAGEERRREGLEGLMEFVTGKPIPYESIKVRRNGSETGMFAPSVRQRRVDLEWHQGGLAKWLANAHRYTHPHGQHWITLPVLGTTAHVNTRAEGFTNQGGPGNREMLALWEEDGYVFEMRAAVPDLAGFEERLGWLTKVDSATWLEAMPANVVKAADHDATVQREVDMLSARKSFGLNFERHIPELVHVLRSARLTR